MPRRVGDSLYPTVLPERRISPLSRRQAIVALADARIALNTLELAVLTAPPDRSGKRHVTLPIIEDAAHASGELEYVKAHQRTAGDAERKLHAGSSAPGAILREVPVGRQRIHRCRGGLVAAWRRLIRQQHPGWTS